MINFIDEYSPIGNSLKTINDNFNLLNIRTCLSNDDYNRLDAAFSTFQSLSSSMNDFFTNIHAFSADWRKVASIVHNTSGFWLEPVNITYTNTFSTIANYREIQSWLDTTFGTTTFGPEQILKISFSVKNYDPSALNNVPLPAGVSTDSLNTLAASYGQNYQDVQTYLGYTNCINAIIASVNNVFKLINRTDLLVTERTQLTKYFNNIIVFQNKFSSTILGDISQDNFTLLYTYLEQYQVIEPQYELLITKGIPNIPATVLNTLQIQNIFSMYFSSMCFKMNANNNWVYIPDCNINFCVDQYCSDCYDFIDVNSLYDSRNCPLINKFKLINCNDDQVWISGNGKFADYLHAFIDIIIDGVARQVYVTNIEPDKNYPNSAILLSNRYSIIGLSQMQACPYVEEMSIGQPEVFSAMALNAKSSPQNKVGVIVTVHPEYIPKLKNLIKSIDKQSEPFDEKIVVLDRAGAKKVKSIKLPKDWTLLKGDWQNPNPARNLGLDNIKLSNWVTFWDADNEMPEDYLKVAKPFIDAADMNVGVLYPNIQQVNEDGTYGHLHKMPEWSYENVQKQSVADTASFWNREALYNVGGFSENQCRHDDYALSLKLLRQNWDGQRLPVSVIHQNHSTQRSQTNDITESLWTAYNFGIVTLWSNYTLVHDKLIKWYEEGEFPPNTTLYWVDNTDGKIYDWLIEQYQTRLASKFKNIVLIRDDNTKTPVTHFERHNNVARLYSNIFKKTKEENIVVTVEDDNIPPTDGIRTLLKSFVPGSNIGEVASIYRSRTNPAHICAALNKSKWIQVPKLTDVPQEPFEVGMTGGGFALYGNWALQKCIPMHCSPNPDSEGAIYGWDGNLGRTLTKNHYRILLDPSVFTEHHCEPVLKYLEDNKLDK